MTIRVLIIEDSPVFQRILISMFSTDPQMEVVGVARDPYEARDLILSLNPDVTTLDINLPRMNGLDFLKRIMQYKPIPVVIISSLTQEGSQEALDALALGAAEVLSKPCSTISLTEAARVLCQTVRAAAMARIQAPSNLSSFARQRVSSGRFHSYKNNSLICIGSSTGGTEAIKQILVRLPSSTPPILITQHMPAMFTKSFAERLNSLSPLTVLESQGHEPITDNHIYIAPGGFHLRVVKINGQLFTSIDDAKPIHFQRPAVDVLFQSIAQHHTGPCAAAILTGMGSDGSDGLELLRKKGAYCVAQDEKSCVVFGMPRVAIERGLINATLPIEKIADALINQLSLSNLDQ